MSNVKTRFAPSPTGRMHVGNLRTALYAYLIAKHDDGTFMLRIEDTDQERFQEGALDIIYRTLRETGLVHDEGPDKDGGCGPYVQSERNAAGLYLKYAKQLVEQGDAYYCFCDAERLSQCKRNVGGKEISIYDKHCLGLSKEEVEANLAAGKPYVIRFNMPTEGTTTFHDEIYGDITVNNEELEDLILIKSDGYPTYNFANVIDDHLMGVTHVVRGNEYLSSSPKYNRIYEAFGWEVPVYVHCPLITNDVTFIFGAKAAPAYIIAQDIIHLLLVLQEIVNNDPDVKDYMKVVMVENYNVSYAERLIPACDISEQISLASKEASGTGNMKFMLNGAVTLGTSDGANVEINELVGDDNIYIFGEKSEAVIEHYAKADYVSRDFYEKSSVIKEAVDFIVSEQTLAAGNEERLSRLHKELINKDWFMTLLDLEDYIATKDRMFEDYRKEDMWKKMMLVNIAKAGFFSSDRTIAEYNRDIWKLK